MIKTLQLVYHNIGHVYFNMMNLRVVPSFIKVKFYDKGNYLFQVI